MILVVFGAMLRSFLRDRGALVMSFALPLVFFLVFAAIFSGATGEHLRLRIALADEVRSPATCVCSSLSENPCLPPPQEVCMYVGDPFASFLAKENPMFRKASQEEALKVLEFAHEKGFVHAVYFKKVMGGRVMAVCNCCSCCCPGIRMWNLLEGTIPIMAASGYVAEVSAECNGCASCADSTCHFNAIRMSEDGQKAVINEAKCMGCGGCVEVCPVNAITLRKDPSRGVPLDIEELQRQAQSP